jgi:hypothetical protein
MCQKGPLWIWMTGPRRIHPVRIWITNTVRLWQCEAYRKKRDIRAITKNMPNPVRTFDEASFPEYVLQEVLKAGYTEPSAIQSQGWPLALSGVDMVGISRTGSGKTLAFLLPGIVHINAQPYLQPGDGPIVLVIAPTRELACQIKVECDKFGSTSKIKNSAPCAFALRLPRAGFTDTLRSQPAVTAARRRANRSATWSAVRANFLHTKPPAILYFVAWAWELYGREQERPD